MSRDILVEMVANKRGGIDPSDAIRDAVIETAHLAPGTDCRVTFDSDTNQSKVFRYWEVIPDEDESEIDTELKTANINQMPLSQAKQYNPGAQVGDSVSEEIHFSRIEFQKFKRLFSTGMRKAERTRVTNAYRSRIGEVLVGTVQRQQFNRDGAILELEEGIELLLPHSEMIPREEIRLNDRLYVYLYDVDPEAKGPQLLVSRASPGLLKGLFRLKILEVDSGVIEIKSVARDAGSRSKVAVKTNDGRLNPIGTCIGRSGERIKAISNELNDEHIDIILWDENPAQLAIHALTPAEIVSITMDEDTHVMDIVVRKEDLPRAIGHNGQNVRLASQLTGWTLNIMSAEEAEKKSEEASTQSEELFTQQLGIDPEHAKKLTQEGFSRLEDIAYASVQELAKLLSVEENQIEDLHDRANDLLLANAFASESELFHDPEDESLESLAHMTAELAVILREHEIDSRESLAELSIDDLLEIAPLTREEAGQLIMSARAHWFKKTTEKV